MDLTEGHPHTGHQGIRIGGDRQGWLGTKRRLQGLEDGVRGTQWVETGGEVQDLIRGAVAKLSSPESIAPMARPWSRLDQSQLRPISHHSSSELEELTASRKSLPAVKAGTVLAGIFIFSLVLGLRPSRSLR